MSKDTLLPWIPSQLYNKDLQEADSSARQLCELHSHHTTNLGAITTSSATPRKICSQSVS